MLDTGFGFVEIGSVVPQPQTGNPKPRVFRLLQDRAVINRYGMNSQGMDIVEKRLQQYRSQSRWYYPWRYQPNGIVGVNLAKNKSSVGNDDYVAGFERLGAYADFVVVNVSSPNTPGLRSLQQKEQLADLIRAVLQQRDQIAQKNNRSLVPVLVKIAPDLSNEELRDIAEVVESEKVDGVVVGNTTISRPPTLQSPFASEQGGLSGAPLTNISTEVLRDFYRITGGRVPLIGVGGVSSGHDAYDKIKAGASLIELYTAMVYNGPQLVGEIKDELAELLRKDGHRSVADAVGADHRKNKNAGV